MMVSVETYLRRGYRQLRRLTLRPGVFRALRFSSCLAGGFLLSAAGLCHSAQPLALGFCSGLSGWCSGAAALGSFLGYRFFWGDAGSQGMAWACAGAFLGLVPKKHIQTPMLIPAAAAFGVSAVGLLFQLFGEANTSFGIYLLRVLVGAASAVLFSREAVRRRPLVQWLLRGVWILALAQVAPAVWLNAGVALCAATVCSSPFPGAVLAGLALDLARITPLPMTAAACTGFLLGRIPFSRRWLRCFAPAAAALALMPLRGSWDLYLLPGLMLGGGIGLLISQPPGSRQSGSRCGHAQVRLEVAAGVLAQLQQLLLEASEPPIDQQELLTKARSRACGSCTLVKTCREQHMLTTAHLHRPTDFACRRPGRIQIQLQLSREQLYAMRLSRTRRGECRDALAQQYRFLSHSLRELADQLPGYPAPAAPRFRIQVSVRSRSRQSANGDRCAAFPGIRCRYYVALCDGMGTGLGAADNAQTALELLRPLLSSGFSPELALESVNSILTLRGQAGAVTVDLAEIRLDTGRATLYKWGAAPSCLAEGKGVRFLGGGSPPPGIRLERQQEAPLRLSLHHGQTLVLFSDGVCTRDLRTHPVFSGALSPAALAEALLKLGTTKGEDDATVAVIRLEPAFI